MSRTITDTADRLRPGDHIQSPDGKWMLVADITYASTDGVLGALAVLLVNPAMGAFGARLMLLGPSFTLDIQRDARYTPRPYPAEQHTTARQRGLGYEVWDTRCLEWVYIRPGQWRDEFGGAMEANEQSLTRLCRIDRVLTAA